MLKTQNKQPTIEEQKAYLFAIFQKQNQNKDFQTITNQRNKFKKPKHQKPQNNQNNHHNYHKHGNHHSHNSHSNHSNHNNHGKKLQNQNTQKKPRNSNQQRRNIRPCRYGEKCYDQKCKRLHLKSSKGKMQKTQSNRLRNNQKQICNYGDRCFDKKCYRVHPRDYEKNKKCPHTNLCWWGEKCNKRNCDRFHPNHFPKDKIYACGHNNICRFQARCEDYDTCKEFHIADPKKFKNFHTKEKVRQLPLSDRLKIAICEQYSTQTMGEIDRKSHNHNHNLQNPILRSKSVALDNNNQQVFNQLLVQEIKKEDNQTQGQAQNSQEDFNPFQNIPNQLSLKKSFSTLGRLQPRQFNKDTQQQNNLNQNPFRLQKTQSLGAGSVRLNNQTEYDSNHKENDGNNQDFYQMIISQNQQNNIGDKLSTSTYSNIQIEPVNDNYQKKGNFTDNNMEDQGKMEPKEAFPFSQLETTIQDEEKQFLLKSKQFLEKNFELIAGDTSSIGNEIGKEELTKQFWSNDEDKEGPFGQNQDLLSKDELLQGLDDSIQLNKKLFDKNQEKFLQKYQNPIEDKTSFGNRELSNIKYMKGNIFLLLQKWYKWNPTKETNTNYKGKKYSNSAIKNASSKQLFENFIQKKSIEKYQSIYQQLQELQSSQEKFLNFCQQIR